MRCALVHNRYQQAGGEDEVFLAEAQLLRANGHEVFEYTRTNDDIGVGGFLSQVGVAAEAVWSRRSHRSLSSLLADVKPDVAHFHNTFPLISPAAYYACRAAGVPIVQTLHNYRLICPGATLFRDGHVCEDCIEHNVLNGVRHGCYRGSRAATAAIAMTLAVHRGLGTWRDQVDAYIVLTEFARPKFIASGLAAERVVVKPNFVHPDPGARHGAGDCALFVGRLSPEKGVATMVRAWKRFKESVPLGIIGDGPERPALEAAAAGLAGVRFLGRMPREQTVAAIKRARFLVLPSEWYEGLPMTLIEAFACGVPVIASRLGAMEEVVADGRTGLHFTAGDADDLAAKVDWAWSHPEEMEAMGRSARAEFEAKYTAERNYEMLMNIYAQAMGQSEPEEVARRTTQASEGVAVEEVYARAAVRPDEA